MAMQSLREGVILSHIDFSENYRFEPQNELQSEYYDSVNVTILVHITYKTIIDPETGVERIVKESHFYVSDDKKHDTLFVQHCLNMHWKWLDEQGVTLKDHIIFSNGVTWQFKNRRGFYYVSRYPGMTKGCQMHWQFFFTAHGKGEFRDKTFNLNRF
jgi:hypothetical protein